MGVFYKAGFIISYAKIIVLYDVLGLEDVSESMFILQEIAKDVPATCIVDNDDFKIDTLTGNSQESHRKNVMFVERQSIEHKSTVENISNSGKKTQKFLKT